MTVFLVSILQFLFLMMDIKRKLFLLITNVYVTMCIVLGYREMGMILFDSSKVFKIQQTTSNYCNCIIYIPIIK